MKKIFLCLLLYLLHISLAYAENIVTSVDEGVVRILNLISENDGATGTGFVINSNNYIVTNHHVIENHGVLLITDGGVEREHLKLADKWFAEGNYSDANQWWELLCEAIDEIYYRKTNTRTATTQGQKQTWIKIRDATINEFHKDRQQKGDNSWSKDRIRNRINESCK